MSHKNLTEIIQAAEHRSWQSLEEHKAASKLRAIPWIRTDQTLPRNDSLEPDDRRRCYLARLHPSKKLAVANFGYAGHDWWIDSFDRLLLPEHGQTVVGWCPLPYDMGDDTLPDPVPQPVKDSN